MYVLNLSNDSEITFKEERKFILAAWKTNSEIFETPQLCVCYFHNNVTGDTKLARFMCSRGTEWQTFGENLTLDDNTVEKKDEKIFAEWLGAPKNITYKVEFVDDNTSTPIKDMKARFFVASYNIAFFIPPFKEAIFDTSKKELAYATSTVGCPLDPLTNKRMESCLNWRRVDDIGKEFLKNMTHEEMKLSARNFCSSNQSAEDCRCLNRRLFDDYNNEKEKYKHLSDYCWYKPCKSGLYLLQENKINCGGTLCSTQYKTTDYNDDLLFPEIPTEKSCELFNPDLKPPSPSKAPQPSKPKEDIFIEKVKKHKVKIFTGLCIFLLVVGIIQRPQRRKTPV